jgi:hypothetical protein
MRKTDLLRASRLALACAGAMLLVGCSGVRQLELRELQGAETGPATVFTRGGVAYELESVTVRNDSLIGSYSIVDVPHSLALPLAQVDRVEVKQVDSGNTVLLGIAGVAVLAVLAGSLADSDVDAGSQPQNAPGDKGGGIP